MRTIQEDIVTRRLQDRILPDRIIYDVASRYGCPVCRAQPGEMCEGQDEQYYLHPRRFDDYGIEH